MTDVLDISKCSDIELQELFDESYDKTFASLHNIDQFESTCKRGLATDPVTMEVLVIGLAGSPTFEDYKNGDLEGYDSITISREDKGGSLTFQFDAEESTILNTNDYLVVYKAD
jgi:hypothetical protein